MSEVPFREAIIDLSAVEANVRTLRERVHPAAMMAVVKANGYGHGAAPIARAAIAAGASCLGVADITEALELRAAGIEVPILAWLHGPDARWEAALEAGIELGVSSTEQLRAIADAGHLAGVRARVQLKLDTGLSRNGIAPAEWAHACETARTLEAEGAIAVAGLFSHLANASAHDDHAAIAEFDRGVALARQLGLAPELLHLASTGPALLYPEARYDLVRIGIGLYGLSPYDNGASEPLGLRPAMSLRARIAAVRRVPATTGVSYGYGWHAPVESTLVLVPLGYADGVPRAASGNCAVSIKGVKYPVVGRIAMDQFVVDVGEAAVEVGDEVVVFGDPELGVPSAGEWAEAAGTINYEIVTRIGHRVPRRYEGE